MKTLELHIAINSLSLYLFQVSYMQQKLQATPVISHKLMTPHQNNVKVNWIVNLAVWVPPNPTGYLFRPSLPPLQYSLHNVRLIASAISSPSSPKWVLWRHQHVWKEGRGNRHPRNWDFAFRCGKKRRKGRMDGTGEDGAKWPRSAAEHVLIW